jgi:hypothetical protein
MRAQERAATDFDGTVTDVEQEAKPFIRAFRRNVATFLDLHPKLYGSYARNARFEIIRSPQHHAWEVRGIKVAPATSDPYILETVTAKLVISRLKSLGYLSKDASYEQSLENAYQDAYKQTTMAFRPDAQEYLRLLRDKFRGVVITNSDTAIVLKKIEKLMGENHRISVIGNARKYIVDPHKLQETLQLTGLPRPVYTARPFYEAVIRSLEPIDAFVGDIYELDLSVPDTQGKHIVQIQSLRTPRWETTYMKRHPRAAIFANLADAIAHLDQ